VGVISIIGGGLLLSPRKEKKKKKLPHEQWLVRLDVGAGEGWLIQQGKIMAPSISHFK